MYESTIQNKIYSILGKNCEFIGTFARDEIPIIKKRPCSFIINTDLKNQKGEHWVGLYIGENNEAFYFDSFGLPPYHKEISDYINNNSNQVRFSTVTLQTPSQFSVTCGHYCIIFIIFMSKGHSFDDLIALFTRNTFLNDMIVRRVLSM